ncbi:MAG: hypothetical protein J0M18_00475 [Ignavibacteria bacterium]|jgi:ATP-dependent protease ClpP protease subunit|nr:hypothetical protein [Ignavibacteria bacterium]
MKSITVEKLDSKTTKDIVDFIHSLKNSAPTEKEFHLELDSTQGPYQFAINIVDATLRAGVKINVECKGELDASGAMLAALSKGTGGRSTAFFSTTFQLYKYTEKNGKIVSSSLDEISQASIAKTFKHLKCNSELINSLLDSGEVFSADTAKKCRIISEVIGLPALKKLTKKGGNNKKKEAEDSNVADSEKNDKKGEIKSSENATEKSKEVSSKSQPDVKTNEGTKK